MIRNGRMSLAWLTAGHTPPLDRCPSYSNALPLPTEVTSVQGPRVGMQEHEEIGRIDRAGRRKGNSEGKKEIQEGHHWRGMTEQEGGVTSSKMVTVAPWHRRLQSGAGMEQRRNERAGETGYPRGNPSTSDIVQHDDSHMRKSESDPVGDCARFAMVGGEQTNRSATAFPNGKGGAAGVGSGRSRCGAVLQGQHRPGEPSYPRPTCARSSLTLVAAADWRVPASKGGGNGRSPRKPADSHLRKSGGPAGDSTRFALVGGERANRSATVAPGKSY
ncbi:hypothetical protein PR048_006859 [Dryococelus australis]|uniref:Uncharacterized protein n=1 Tax=Dryococelus australis TaxID=614101 RepID=A0ABQ9ICQ4_9NEOP|nr:hypothetical protein PR048_006859 [Dryococelus australis]